MQNSVMSPLDYYQSALADVGVVVPVLICPVLSMEVVWGVLGKHQTDVGPPRSQGGVLTGRNHHLNHGPETMNVTNSFKIYSSNFDIITKLCLYTNTRVKIYLIKALIGIDIITYYN